MWSAVRCSLPAGSAALGRAAFRVLLPLLVALTLLAPIVVWAAPPPGLPGMELSPRAVAPERARVGMVVTKLYDFNVQAGTFGVEFWLWSLEPSDGRNLLNTSSFANGAAIVRSPIEVFNQSTDQEARKLYVQKIRGTFRHDWDLTDFPFDQQNLSIVLEEDLRESSELVMVPDEPNTLVDAEISSGWRLDDWSIAPGQRLYQSRFGDHVSGGTPLSRYARLVMTMKLTRVTAAALWRLCAAPLAAVLLVLLSYAINGSLAGAVPARAGLVGASLFAEIISLRAVGGEVGNGSGLTLVEGLHLLAIVYTLFAAMITSMQCVWLARSTPAPRMRRLDHRAALLSSLVLTVLVGITFLKAMQRI